MRRFLAFAFLAPLLVLSGCGRDSVLGYLTDPLPPPHANPEPGDYDGGFTLGFNAPSYNYHDGPGRLVIHYTENPALSMTDRAAWNVFDYENWAASSIPVDGPRTFRAFCYIDETTFSEVKTYDYVFRPQRPYAYPAPGAYYAAQTIYLHSPSGGDVYYTTDGADPAGGTGGTGPFQLDEFNPAIHIRAIARTANVGWVDSLPFEGYYTYLSPQALSMNIVIRLPGNVEVSLPATPATLTEGAAVSITSNPTGGYTEPVTFAWYRNGALVNGVTGNTLSYPSGLAPGTYEISVVMTDYLLLQYSAAFFLIVLPLEPVPSPAAATLAVTAALPDGSSQALPDGAWGTLFTSGDPISLTARLANGASFIADWYVDGALVVDGTVPAAASTFSRTAVAPLFGLGSHGVSCIATAGGYQYSWTHTLEVQ